MKVLILGKSTVNAEIEKILSCPLSLAPGESIETAVIQDASQIIKFRGEPGNYTVTTSDGSYSFASVLITEPPRFEGIAAGGGVTLNLMDEGETGKLDSLKTAEKIVILLDYAEETPEYITAKAMDIAKRLAGKKKEVVFLSKTVKSAAGGNELRYREARNSGVAFVKYEKLTLNYDEEADRFKITANDGVFDFNIDTPYVLSAAGSQTPELKTISKKLRLYLKPDGINDDRFFLYPAFTARQGIYYLNPALVIPGEESVRQAALSIMEDMTAAKTVKDRHPEVDKDKCAFCYSCFRACPHGALEPDLEANAMKVVQPLCQNCGACMAICPGEAIRRKEQRTISNEQLAISNEKTEKTGSEKQSDDSKETAYCKIYCCENGAAAAFEEALPSLGEHAKVIDCEQVACGGSVSTDRLVNDFKEYKTVIVACCHEGSCRHIDGDKRACKQSLRTAELLNKSGLGGRRVEVIRASHASGGVIKENILNILEGTN
jgi:NAD-dependent dihydropyrimidine dehydrogenase PreA subunit/coenzyme F420-reducing hydrogenase delta subunit